MKSETFKYLLVIFVTTLFCAVKTVDCFSGPLLSIIRQEHVRNPIQLRSLKTNDSVHSDSVGEILRFWKHHEDRMNIGSQKDVTIFLGTTGSGKSTIISLLAADDLESVEIYEGADTFKIVDKLGRISQNSTILSQTLIPELIVDNVSGVAYFDCPGFKDTRGVKYDITITYLIRKLLEFANSVKFVFVIAHSQVSDGGDRHGIIDLAKHVNGLIKNIDKFSNGIGLVVTKVENVAKVSKGSITFVNDNDTLKGIQRFLSRAKNDLETLNGNDSLSISEMKANEGAIKFINTLLRNGSDGRPRIGLLRKPLESGLLSNMSMFQAEKNVIKTMINQSLQYIQKESDDFGFTLTDESKNHAYSLLNEIKNRSAAHITVIGAEIVAFYTNQEEDYKSLIVLYSKASLLNHTLDEIVVEDPQLYANFFLNALKSANIDRITEPLNQVQTYMEYINFLTNLIESNDLDLSQVTGALSKVKQNIKDYLIRLFGKIEGGIIARVFDEYDRIELGISRAESQNFDLIYLKDLMFDAHKNLPTIGDSPDIGVFLKQLVNSSIFKKFDLSPERLADITATIDFLNSSRVDLSTSCQLSISNEANKIAGHFEDLSKWYTFLTDLYEKLSEMDLKSNEFSFNQIKREANDIMEKCSIEETQEINVSEIGLQQFLDAIDIKINYYDVKTLQINGIQSKALKSVLAMTINDEVKCSTDGSTISGFNVKMSDAIQLECWQISNTIKVFASDKILIDVDIDRTNDWNPKKFSIIAPIWRIIGNRRINLNGKNARNFEWSASDGNSYSIDGHRGSPGRSGNSAGSFFGIGHDFINGSMLSIHANGGDGGSGQDGGKGYYKKAEYYEPETSFLKGVFVFGASVLGFFAGGPPGAAAGAAGSTALVGASGGFQPITTETNGFGGDGGASGLAGHHGFIQMIDLKNSTQISTSTLDGQIGNPGKGAYSGSGNSRGRDGAYGYSFIEKPAPTFTTQQKIQIVNEYKQFAVKNMMNNIRQTILENFVKEMNQSALRY